jgi:citrate lyase subunit beta/citryl-CoA lyase
VSGGEPRSWLFVPGDNERRLARVFDAGADEVIIDLEDSVVPSSKAAAREQARDVLEHHRAWVRINAAGTPEAEQDLAAVGGRAAGIRVPKVQAPEDVAWVRERAPDTALTALIETALGLHRAFEIASAPGVQHLAIGAADLAADLGVDPSDDEALRYARSRIVVASRAAGLPGPYDGAWTGLDDDEGLRRAALAARRLGFIGKSALHPRQVPVIHDAFAPTAADIAWATSVSAASEAAGQGATRTVDGQFVDRAVVERARRLLEAARVTGEAGERPAGRR